MFETDNPKWSKVYEVASRRDYGAILTFEEFRRVGLDVQGVDRNGIYNANKRLLKDHKKMLVNVRGVGYKIANAPDQVRHASFRRIRGGRQFMKGKAELEGLDFSRMSTEEKIRVTHLMNRMDHLAKIAYSKVSKGIEDTAKSLASQNSAKEELDKLAAQIAAIKDRLED